MIVHGQPPYLECSSKGDRRFSAFYAKVNGRSIEEQYQGAKQFRNLDGTLRTNCSWRQAKGKRPINAEAVAQLYSHLWDQYMEEHPELLDILKAASGVSDRFGQVGHVCQATELWRIRNAALAQSKRRKLE